MKTWLARRWSSPSRRNGPSPRRPPLRLEQLEDRLAPAVITVTTASDDLTPNDGSVALREAITAVNAGNDLGDPDIINPVTIDGYTQTGASVNTQDNTDDAVILIQLDGPSAGTDADGLMMSG